LLDKFNNPACTKNMTTLDLRKSIGQSPLRLALFLIPLLLGLFALSPAAQAQLPSPTPDGGYPGQNTAEGDGFIKLSKLFENSTPEIPEKNYERNKLRNLT
jgi:hypothetical protein